MWKKVLAVALILAIGASIIWLVNPLSPALKVSADTYKGGFHVSASKTDASGVAPDSQFILMSNRDVTLDFLKENVSIRGEEKPDISQSPDGFYLITPKKPLEPNRLYFIDILAEDGSTISFAFQTQKEFTVLGSLPADTATYVPVDTGIEVYFSYPDVADIAPYFEISPKVEGRFEHHGYTWSFIPKKLEPGTIYTVTIKGVTAANGSKALDEAYTFSFETNPDSLATANPDKGGLYIQNSWFDFSTFEAPVIPFNIYVYGNRSSSNAEITADVYRFADLESFIETVREKEKVPAWAWYNYSLAKTDVSSLEKVMSFKQSFNLDSWRQSYMMFPESLSDGYYLIELSYDGLSAQAFLQATDTAAFYMEDETSGLFWVNDLKTGQALDNATIEDVINGKPVTTNASGLARLGLPVDKKTDTMDLFKITTASGKVSLLNAGYGSPRYYDTYSAQSLQWRYLQTDRTLYKPDDTVMFWGFIKSRIDGSSPSEITVELSQGGYYRPYYGGFLDCYLPFIMGKPLETVTLKTDGGFYEGSLKLPALDQGSYSITVKSGDKVLSSSYINVEDYIKPQYKLTITSDKNAVFVGEPVTFKIQAAFYDGTPVANVPVRYFINEWGGTKERTGTTDTRGELTFDYTPNYQINMQGECYFAIHALTSLPETGEISQYYSFRVFANDIQLLTKGEVKNGVGTASVAAHKVDLTTLNDDDNTNDSSLGDVLPGQRASVSVYSITWDKIEVGEEYDFVNKVVRKLYEYRERKELITQKYVTTGEDGKASFDFPAASSFEGYYIMETTAVDTSGRTLKYQNSVIDNSRLSYPAYYDYYHLKTDKQRYRANENATVRFYNNETPVSGFKTLFVESRNGILGYEVKDQPQYVKAFDEKLSPNYYVDGIMFTGKSYIQSNCVVAYDYQEKSLNLKVETDKESYKPGEPCIVTITATDKDGKPVKAKVNISLVDEALLALSGQYIDPLTQLYSWIGSGITRYSTNRNNNPVLYGGVKMTTAAADEGGARDTGRAEMPVPMPSAAPLADMNVSFSAQSEADFVVRSDFKDTAAFSTIQLDESGKATLNLKLPDNITSFRLTAAAISNDLHAGSQAASTKVSMPFFINDALSLEYLAGDKPNIGVTAYGQELSEDDAVSFEVIIKELPDYKQNASAKAFERVNIPLPQLTEGTYTLEIYAKSASGQTDALRRTIEVIPSYRTIETSSLKPLTAGMTVDAGKSGLTTLIITDEGRGKVANQLHGLAWGYGNRLDQKLTAYEAQKLLKKITGDDVLYFDPINLDAASYKNDDGGFGILPYSESDIKLTALLAPYLKEVSDETSMKMYFYNALLSGEQINAAALYGLAALGEPVLLDLEKAKDVENLSLTDYMLIGMAFAQLHEYSDAVEIYNTRIASHLEKADPYIRVKVRKNDTDACLEETALLAAFAAMIDLDDADKMYEYISNNYSRNVYTGVEKLIYLSERLEALPDQTVTFDYTYNGKTYTVKLEEGYSETIKIPSVKVSEFKVTSVSGKASILSLYMAPLSGSGSKDGNVVLTRKYYNALTGEEMTTFKQNDIVKVEITYDIKNGVIDNFYEISDYAPSGLKPISNPWNYGLGTDWGFYYRTIDGQKVTFVVGKHTDKNWTVKPLTYYCRVASPGEYVAEGTVAQGSIVKSSITTIDNTIITILP